MLFTDYAKTILWYLLIIAEFYYFVAILRYFLNINLTYSARSIILRKMKFLRFEAKTDYFWA